MKKIIGYILIVLIGNASFLLSPRLDSNTPNSQCAYNYVRINKYLGFHVNCDAFPFIGSAINPGYIFQSNSFRQSRPGYIMLGTITGYSIFFITTPLHPYIDKAAKNILPPEISKNETQKGVLYVCFYIGFILVNLVLLVISIILFEKIITALSGEWKNGNLLFLTIVLLLSANQLTKYLFWTAHSQMFNILTPLLCIYTGLLIKKKKENINKILLLSFGSGCLVLFYGSFLLLLPVILFAHFLSEKTYRNNLLRTSLKSILITGIFFIPTILWILSLKIYGINFYSAEIQKLRQFVWITDAAGQSPIFFLHSIYNHLINYLKTFPTLLFSAVLLALAIIYKKNTGKIKPVTITLPESLLIKFTLLEFFIFFWLLGYYADRLTFSMAPILLCCFALLINQQKIENKPKYLFISIILLWHLYTIFFNTPHYSASFFS